MAIPPLEKGCLPPGRYRATVDEVHGAFVACMADTAHRQRVFDRWLLHREALSNLVPIDRQWINGSFVTDKPDPGDMDVVTFFDGEAFDTLPEWKQALAKSIMHGHHTEQLWNVDSFQLPVYSEDHPLVEPVTNRARGYWDWQWSRRKGTDGEEKGYLEVMG